MRDGKMKQPAMEELIRPDPHPLDYDWRFTDETSMRIADRFFQGDYVLILGCPSIALRLNKDVRYTLIDRQPLERRYFDGQLINIDINDTLELTCPHFLYQGLC